MWRVLVTIARGHARFETSLQEYGPPSRRFVKLWSERSGEERDYFLRAIGVDLWSEVGRWAIIATLEGVARRLGRFGRRYRRILIRMR